MIVDRDKILRIFQGSALIGGDRRREKVREPFLIALFDKFGADRRFSTKHVAKDKNFILRSPEVNVVLAVPIVLFIRWSSMLFQISLHSENDIGNDVNGGIFFLEAVTRVVADGSRLTPMIRCPLLLATVTYTLAGASYKRSR